MFYNDATVLYVSIHRHDQGMFFPGRLGKIEMLGEGTGNGYNIQFPYSVTKTTKENHEGVEMDNLIGDEDYMFACESVFFPIIREFTPDMIIISAGFDSAKGDLLGGVGVSPVGYAWMT